MILTGLYMFCISKGFTSESECELLAKAEMSRMEARDLKNKVKYFNLW